MALLDRLKAFLAPAEDPRKPARDGAGQLEDLRRALSDLAATRVRLQGKSSVLDRTCSNLEQRARNLLGAGQEDAARGMLEQRQLAGDALSRIEHAAGALELEEQRLTAQLEALSAKQQLLAAAEAQLRLSECLAGLTDELRQAEERADYVQARAAAIEFLNLRVFIDDGPECPGAA